MNAKMVNWHRHLNPKGNAFMVVLFGVITSLSSCIKEDVSDCPVPIVAGVTLKYKYDMNMEYKDLFAQNVQNLQAFIFNSEGVLCDTLKPPVGSESIVQGWERNVDLEPGTYSVVTWAGSDKFYDCYHTSEEYVYPEISKPGVVIGKTKIEDFRMFLNYLKIDDDNATPYTLKLKELYHGIVQNIVVKADEKSVVLTNLIKNTNVIKITIDKVNKLSSFVSAADFEINIKGRNGHYKYNNDINEKAHLINYLPFRSEIVNDSFIADINVMRLMKPEVDIFENGTILLTITYKPTGMNICKDVNLVDLILSGRIPAQDSEGKFIVDQDNKPILVKPSIDYLDRQDNYEIKYEITKGDDGNFVFTVFVNDWKISNIYPVWN